MRRALLVLFLAMQFLPLVDAAAQAPRLTAGDFWEYHGAATAGNASANVTIRAEVLGLEDVTVNDSTTQGALKVRTATRSVTSTGVDNTADVTSWHRPSDLARAEGRIDLQNVSQSAERDEHAHQGVSSRTELMAWRCASAGTSGGTPRLSFPALTEPEKIDVPRDTPAPGLFATLAGIALAGLLWSRSRPA